MAKIYENFVGELQLACDSRAALRKTIVDAFLEEKKGYWNDDGAQVVTRYKYVVEDLHSGQKIFLQRPATLNNGMDFQVCVEKFNGPKDRRPSHSDILGDILVKKREHPKAARALLAAIERVWNCEDPDIVVRQAKLPFKEGLSLELLLKTLKWLFIEQDVTYWNYDGRMMLLNKIREELHPS